MASGPMPPTKDEQLSSGIDDLHFSLQAEQEHTQKKTFTCWINSQLAKHIPPSVITDLFTDIKKGHVLLDLLEVLSGQQLAREKGSNTFQCRSNIEHALTFLKKRSIKLINIHVADIVEGNPSIILGLIWTIILHFHIEELAWILSCNYNQPSLDCVSVVDLTQTSGPPPKKRSKAQARWKMSAKKALLLWAQEQCAMHGSVNVTDFKSSWRNGMAFLAVIHALRPDLIDMNSVKGRSSRDNLKEAFRIAEHELNIPRLLDPEDVDVINPDEKSIMTYVAQFLQYSRGLPVAVDEVQEKVKDATAWLISQEEKLHELQMESEKETYFKKSQGMRDFLESFNEEKKAFLDVLSIKRNVAGLADDQSQLRQAWDKLTNQINEWSAKLDQILPPPLDQIEVWLQEIEHLMAEDLPDSQDYSQAMILIKERINSFKSLMDDFDCRLNSLLTFENKDEQHMPMVPPDKLEEMKRRFHNIMGTNFIALLEFHYYLCFVLGLIEEVKSKLNLWNIKYGAQESVELLLGEWHKFIEEEEFLTQLESSFQKCETMIKNLAGDPQNISKQFKMVESQISMCRKCMYNIKSTLQKVLSSWTTYKENLHSLKTCFEESRKEDLKQIPFETLASWNSVLSTVNEVGKFLIDVSNQQVGLSINKELKRLNKRWAKFIKKTQFEMKLRFTQEQEQPSLESTGSTGLPLEENSTCCGGSTDISAEALRKHIQHLKTGKENEAVIKEFTELLQVLEEMEEFIDQVATWETEIRPVLDFIKQQGYVEASMEESLQNLIARGSMYQEHVNRKENALQIISQTISSKALLQHFHTSGLRTQIIEAKDKVQNNMAELDAVLQASYESSLEMDVRVKFEKSQKELESAIMKARQLLGQKGSLGDLVSQKKDILAILNSKSLDKFLKATEQLKNIVSPDEKLSLEEISGELSKEWEGLHQKICLYIHQMKNEIEKKLTENISKLEKQLNKERKLLSKGKTKGLIEEHEACFSDEGILCQLDHHMEALRDLSEGLTSEESRQEIRKTIIEYGQRQNGIKNTASEIYMMLQALIENTQTPEKMNPLSASENGGGDAGKVAQPSKPNDVTSPEEASGSASFDLEYFSILKHHEDERNTKDGDVPFKKLLERYDAQRDNLEMQLQSNKIRVLSDFPSEKERSISCLQDKLADLQVLKNETDSSWTEFEMTSSKLENIVGDPERSVLSRTRDKLKRKKGEFQMTLSNRLKSLEAALRIVLPKEKEAVLLGDSEQLLHEMDIQEFNLAGVDDAYQNLKDIQSSIAKQIELCSNLEHLGSDASNEFNPVDLHATQNIIAKYKTQFEEMNHKMQNTEIALKALEDFLASLRKAKLSIQAATDFSTSDVPVVQVNTWTIEDVKKKIPLMKDEARCLDQRMKMLDISLKNAEQGEDICCEKVIEVFSKMIDETHGHNEPENFTEQDQLLEVFIAKNNEIIKNIKYIQEQINKIGLKDPTIPAVKQRIKSLTKLEKDLDYYAGEINYLRKMASSLPQVKDGKGEIPSQQCQETTCLWEDVKSSVEECLEQCQRAMDLLKQYQNCKSILTSLIHKEESVISLQASYMGKENLKRRIAKIETVREELNKHSEDVEKINQICKNLQFQLNKMITFAEPPFEKEANVIVDRWLDINEKTENYYDNLVRALALWEKLLNLTNIIDEWIEKVLRKVEVHQLNDTERTRLQEELKIQEQNSVIFGVRLVEIQDFLQISEPPLELQVIKSSFLNRIEKIKMHLMDKSNLSELNGSTAELKEDLDQAKTQIGMTESLLKALSPSDSLEIFTKLEEIQQQILQQKHNMTLLENQIGCLTPELSELKKQYESINDLFSTKKRTLQDHFSNLLNDQCKNFDDGFNNIQLSLKECFEPPETKKSVEEKLQKLNDFLTFEGRSKDIQQVETALNNVKRHLPKASVEQLNDWIMTQELELQKMKFTCQTQANGLHDCLQQLLRLQDDYMSLNKWLMNQEEKWKETGVENKCNFFFQALTRKRQLFESFAQLNNSLKKFGLIKEEIVVKSTRLIEEYETFLTQVCEIGNHQSPPAEDQSFEDLVHDVFSWIMGIKESLMVLNSTEGKMPLEERIQKIKEIILLKPEGDVKIQNIMSLGEKSKASLVQDTLSDIKNQWDHTIHLANTYLSHQEKIQLEGEKYLQSKDDLRLMLTELKKKQESGFALQNGLQEKKTQLKIYKKFLQKAEDLTSLLNELKTQGNYLLECTKNSKFSEEKWLEVKHLHESLLHQLQDSVSKLEGHVQEHQLYQDLVADLSTTLESFSQEFISFPDNLADEKAAEQKVLKLQELEAFLNLKTDTLEKILALAESIKQNSSSVGQKIIKDETDSLKCKHKDLENRLESVKQETENSFNNILKSKSEMKKKEKIDMKKRVEQISSGTQDSIQGSVPVEKLEEKWEVNKVGELNGKDKDKEEPKKLRMKDSLLLADCLPQPPIQGKNGESPTVQAEMSSKQEHVETMDTEDHTIEPNTFEKNSVPESTEMLKIREESDGVLVAHKSQRESAADNLKNGQMNNQISNVPDVVQEKLMTDQTSLEDLETKEPLKSEDQVSPLEKSMDINDQIYRRIVQDFQLWLNSKEQFLGFMLEEQQGEPVTGKTLLIFENSGIEMLLSKQLFPEAQESMKNIEDEQRVNELQNQPLELDIISANEQLKEIEVLYGQLQAKKANTGSQESESAILPSNTETSTLDVQNVQHSVDQLDRLLQALVNLKEDKERQYSLIKDFQEHLLAVTSSMKALSMEKESIKAASLENIQHLKKLEKCLDSVHKEKDSLNKFKEKQANLLSHLSDMDRKLAESQVKQLELCWEQVEQWIQKKYFRQAAEWDELQCLMGKIQDMENSLQEQQQQQQQELNSPSQQGENKGPVSLATKFHVTKDNFSLLKRRAEHRMKRIWGKKEKKTLENAINNLQQQLEALEPLTAEKDSQLKSCLTMKKIQEAVLWVNNLLVGLEQTAALLPENIVSQIRKHKTMHDEVLDKQPIIESLVEETKDVIPDLNQWEATDLNTFSQELQSLNQALVSKCTEMSQQLESKLKERSTFFEKMGKVQSSLQEKELLIAPETKTNFSTEDLDHQLVTLKDSQKELQMSEGVISTHLQEATGFSKCLNVFERVFLDDQLRNLKSKARRTQRLVQNKCHEVRKKLDIDTEFLEKTNMLQQELNKINNHELLLNEKVNQGTKEEICELRERTSLLQSNVLQLAKHKEIFECLGLNWDSSQLDKIQAELFTIKTELQEKAKQLERVVVENERLQTSLNELKMVTLQIKKETAEIVNDPNFSPESSLHSAQILSQRVEKATHLCQETIDLLNANETFKESFKQKIPQIKLLAEENDKLYKSLQNMVENFQPRSVNEKDFKDQMERTLHVLTQANFQLQQPLQVGLEIKHIQEEKDNCEVLEQRVMAELCHIKAITVKEYPRQEDNPHETRDLETKLYELEDLQIQFNTSIALRKNILDEALKNMKRYNEAVTRAVSIINSFETTVDSHKIDLDNLEKFQQLTDGKQEEFGALVVDLENLTSKLENITSPAAKVQLEHVLCELTKTNSLVKESTETKKADLERCLKSYDSYNKIKQKICTDLNKVEKGLQQSISQEPMSYREALERLEQSKNFVADLVSSQKELTKLRQDFRCLRLMCTENDSLFLLKIVSALWERWLSLLENAKEWELYCEELKQEWKFVSEEIEREAIILDNLQEEFPESTKPKEEATNEELSEALECFCQYEENLEREQLLLNLLLHRIKNILSVPESIEATESVPVLQEIWSMQDRCTKLSQKAQANKKLVQSEIEERNNISKEIIALKNLFEKMMASFNGMALEDDPEKEDQLEALQRIIDKEKLALENIMEKLRIKYSEMYTIVPAEIECQMEECKKTLEDIDEKIRNEVLKSSPFYMMSRKIEEINHGLQNVEKMLQQKSKNIEQAQEIQKKMWDELDLWHSKLNELDSEVQDIVEQDPGQAQEWMDNLMVPFQQYQQVSQRAEQRTSQLNKATLKMEEYNDLLRNTETWIENTSSLLDGPTDYSSSKALSHHANTLQMALEDSEQKQNLLHFVYSDLEEFSVIFETDDLAPIKLNQLSARVTILQQKLMASLPQIQHMADEVVAIETEVKAIEKKVSKIKAILFSKEIFDFSPEEHLKHGEVILENIKPMKKAIAKIESYQVVLRLPETGMKSLPVFERTNQLSQEVKMLEKVTYEQNEVLKLVMKQTGECDQEIENLKHQLKNYSPEFSSENFQAIALPEVQREIDSIKEQILGLNQKKEDLLMGLKTTVLALHQRLQQEKQELEKETEESGVAEGDVSEWKLKRKGSMFLPPSIVEEIEESSQKSENGDERAESASSPCLLHWVHERNKEEDRASSSSGTLIQEADGRISTYDGYNTQISLPNSPKNEENLDSSPSHIQEEVGDRASIGAPAQSSGEQGSLEEAVASCRPESVEILHVCQKQVAELELWLDKANLSFRAETLNPEMQQMVEQELAGCQAMLTEIEHKVSSLLENCKDQGLGNSGSTQQEAEILSLKLKAVKCNLEKVQVMLQDKYSEVQRSNTLKKPSEDQKVFQSDRSPAFESISFESPLFGRPKCFQQQALELKPGEQKDLLRFIEIHAEKMWHQQDQRGDSKTQDSLVSPGASHSRNGSPESVLPSQEQSEDKWRYLLQELSKEKLPPPQPVDDQIAANVNFLPMVPVHNVSSPTTEELKTYTSQLEDLSQEANALHAQENLTGESSLNLDKKIFDLLLSISQCLNIVEEMVQTSGLSREDAAVQQAHYETLSLELQKLHSAVTSKRDDLLKLLSQPGKNSSVFFECFNNLQTRLDRTRAAAASRSQSMKSGIDHNSDYQRQVRQLYDQLIEKKSSIQHSLNEISSQSIVEQLQKADLYAVKLQDYESRVTKLRDEGERLYLPYVLIQEVYKLEDVLDDMWGLLRAKHAELSSPFISESQQEGLLRGLAELVNIGKEKLGQDQQCQAKSKASLQAQLQNHKTFFQKLVADIFLIQEYSKKILPSLLQNKEKFWADKVKEVKLLEQQAYQYGTKLENLLQEWKEFDENYESLEKDLEILGSSLPSMSLVEETEERLMERISFYQQIKRNIDEKHTKLYQTMNEGKHLATAVSCPELESQIAKLEEQWLALNKKVDHELHRLQTLLRHLVSYNKDSDELTKWLESAQQTLNYWKEQSLNVSQDLDIIRSNINDFFEFSKEVDEKSSLKTSVISTGNQLLHLKEADTATLRSSLAQFEQKWATLITQLPDIQEKLHQLQMEKLPSRKAITEMINWMDNVEQQTTDEATVDSPSSVTQVKSLLQKYKEFRMEMNYKQWIIDFVNQSLLQLSTSDVESKRYERTEFAECLGEMNRQWHKLHGTLNRKIQHLEQLLESITESENKIQTLRTWMEAQGERLKMLQKPGSVISVRKMLLDCQDLENHLAAKSRTLDELKENYMALESGPMPVLQDTICGIDGLYQMRNNIVNQVNQLKTSMQSVLQQGRGYDKLFEEVNMMTIRFWYCVEHNKPDVLSLEALRCQVKNLQLLQDEAESSEGNWSKLQDAIRKLKDCCPSVTEIMELKCHEAHTRWTRVNHEVADQLQSAQSMLQLWESYTAAHAEATARLEQLEEKFKHILNINMSGDNMSEILIQALKDAKNLQRDLENIKETFLQNSAVIEPNLEQAGPVKQDVLSNQSSSLQRISYLQKMLLMKSNEFEHVLSQLKDFRDQLEALEDDIKHPAESLDLQGRKDDPEFLLNHMLELTALSPDMEHLNEVSFKLPLSDIDIKTLQKLNRKWSQATATALEKCSELQGTGFNETFFHKYEKWIQFLEKIEEYLKMNLAGRLEDLLEQQKTFEMLQAEISVNQPVADCFVSHSLQLLDMPEIEKRTEFIVKLTILKERWQDATQRAQQRRIAINERVKEWRHFSASLQNVTHFLTNTDHFLSAVKSQDSYSLHQIRSLIHDLKNKEVLLQRQQTTCALTLEAGRKLLTIADPETKDFIDRKIRKLQDTWRNCQLQVAEMTKEFQSTTETWDRCEKQIKELESRLQTLKAKIKDPLPEPYEELYKEKELIKELEKSLANWAQNLKELNIMKADITQYILVEDVMVLKEQIDHLHRQWEELCLRVSLRKQEIEERLNSWIVFNEKNKDLCAWLVQMENKVLQTADISIEEMIERLQKDCMEEINLFSENKLHLKQMGDQLIKASNKTRVAEIDDKLSKINDRWQHLFDVIGSRVKKLKETFAFIQQLDKNMSNLRSWLARIESELSKPVVYDICDDQEIQKRLAEQQDLQRDIEQHSAGVESVFNICDVLLHDSDACANETECDSIQQTTRSLDRRWRNICAMSMERRMKIEETWRLWQKFLDDYSRFEDWLKSAEKTAAYPNSSEVLYTNAKEELKKFEAFQWQIHERLTQLELINKQYRRLARENRTDTASKLKQMVHEGNQRWDNLQRRVTAILRRLKHFTNQREEFEGTRESILVWLTEMDLQLTNVEHFSESDVDDKMRQLHGFQQEITLNTNKIDQLIVFGEQLIQKSEPMDAVLIEDELEELHRYCQEVFGRVARFHRRLTSHNPGLDDEKEASENETDVEDSREIQSDSWHKKEVNEGPSSPQSLCHLMPPPLGHERSGCETPVSVDSIPLEWDHTGDVGGSSSHEDDEEGPYYSAVSDVEITENPEAYLKMTTKTLKASSGKSISEAHGWHTPDSPTHQKHHYQQTEVDRNVLPITPETSTPYSPEYVKQLIPPGMESVDNGREGPGMLNASEQKGLTDTEQQAGVFDSWELIQAQDLRNKLRTKQNLKQWQQLDSDINDVTLWLKGTEAELEELEMAEPAANIQETELRVKKLKDILKAFDNYKALVISINLSSKKLQQPDNTESKELQNRLRQLNLLWEKANHLLDSWRESLQHSLMQCQDFHQLSQSLLLWLASAENRRCKAQVVDSNADPHTILECQKELMQLEKELLEHQLQVSSLQEISKYLLAKGDGEDYIEADEKVNVIGKKLNQLLDQVSQDLESLQGSQDEDTTLTTFDNVDSSGHDLSSKSMPTEQEKVGAERITEEESKKDNRAEHLSEPPSTLTSSGPRSFLYRVFRAALPFQLFFLLFLLLACMIPSSEEDYSCTQANNFARSFYPMLRYINGPPPT